MPRRQVRLGPPKARNGRRARRVLETDPAGVAVGIESGEDAAGVEFAAVGLVAIRAAGELHVRKAAAQRVRTRFDVAFRYEGWYRSSCSATFVARPHR